jgi:hypothetical protein
LSHLSDLTCDSTRDPCLAYRLQCHSPGFSNCLNTNSGNYLVSNTIVLVPDVVTAVQVSGSGGSSTAEARQQAEAERHGRELAPWWKNDEAMMPVEDTQEQDQAGSDPSNVTVWPVVTHEEEIDLAMQRLPAGIMSRDQYYRPEDLGVEMQNLGTPRRVARGIDQDQLMYPDEFDMSNADRQSHSGDGFERQGLTRPDRTRTLTPMPIKQLSSNPPTRSPQRDSGMTGVRPSSRKLGRHVGRKESYPTFIAPNPNQPPTRPSRRGASTTGVSQSTNN